MSHTSYPRSVEEDIELAASMSSNDIEFELPEEGTIWEHTLTGDDYVIKNANEYETELLRKNEDEQITYKYVTTEDLVNGNTPFVRE